MAAYASLLSLMHIIEQIQNHPRPPISLQNQQIESLTQKVAFFQGFLEAYNSHGDDHEVESLKSRISDAAHAAEDVIESRVVDQIRGQFAARNCEEEITDRKNKGYEGFEIEFSQSLQEVIEDMDLIERDVMEIKDKKQGILDQLKAPSLSRRSSSMGQSSTMVGFDGLLYEMLDKLTGQKSDRQIIPIVGMGGIGKTTLARNVFVNPLIEQHFDIRAWATISQEYDVPEILYELLQCRGSRRGLFTRRDMKERLYKMLCGRRYLIVLDDMWDVELWDEIKILFPDNSNGSRIIITTRQSKLASQITGSYGLEMSFLAEDKSWSLFCRVVFGEEDYPPELEDVGMKIARNCKGLPLSIGVIGGVLAKSEMAGEYWEYIAENLNSIVNLEENERCSKLLRTSYDQLPVHLQPCFLYIGMFPEDSKIRISQLTKLWAAEGFLKPMSGKSLEESAEDYLLDLIDRNLILVSGYGHCGKIKYCSIHDLLRDLCLREARGEKFFRAASHHNRRTPLEGKDSERRIAIHQSTSKEDYLRSLESVSGTRSLICYFQGELPLPEFRLLRILETVERGLYIEDKINCSLESISQLVNSRYLSVNCYWKPYSTFPSSFYLLCNLQSLIIKGWNSTKNNGTFKIWKMPLLRHVEAKQLHLSDPSSGQKDVQDDFVLENLQTLVDLMNLKLSEEVVQRIPNVKKLKISYDYEEEDFEVASHYSLNKLVRLHKLESLGCRFIFKKPSRYDLLQNFTFPHSLKKLTLWGTYLNWEDMTKKLGLLPHLQMLKLRHRSFTGPKWETVEGQFPSLRYLEIGACHDLIRWKTESTHFPLLRHLVLQHMYKLRKIPSGIGEIPTLESIKLSHCREGVIISARKIFEEQEELGNEGLQIQVSITKMNPKLRDIISEWSPSSKFQVLSSAAYY